MKIFTIPAAMAMLASTAFAHSWLECVDTRVPNKAAAQAHPADTRPSVIPPPTVAPTRKYVLTVRIQCRALQGIPA